MKFIVFDSSLNLPLSFFFSRLNLFLKHPGKEGVELGKAVLQFTFRSQPILVLMFVIEGLSLDIVFSM